MTIRVLDAATYTENLSLTLPSVHAGITLEAPRRATLVAAGKNPALVIMNVPNVTVRAFDVKRRPRRATSSS
jgi:hypothetical protein